MGYDQYLYLHFTGLKDCKRTSELKIKKALKLTDEEWEGSRVEKSEVGVILEFDWVRRVYSRNGIFGWSIETVYGNKEAVILNSDSQVDLRDVSRHLGCKISLEYLGEDRDDGERMVILDGRVISREVLSWVESGGV